MSTASVRALLRVAGRDAWRHRGRSLLIVLTLAFPVVGLVSAATLIHALHVPATVKADWQIGTADGLIGLTGNSSVTGPNAIAAVSPRLPAGSQVVAFSSTVSRLASPGRLIAQTNVSDLPYGEPIAKGMVHPVRGRAPVAVDEVAVSQSLADADHLHLGSTVTLIDVGIKPLRVVGVAEHPDDITLAFAWVAPGQLVPTVTDPPQLLVRLPASASPAALQSVGGPDYSIETRASLLDQPPSSALPTTPVSLTVLVAGLGLLEAVLMAGAAFAVGARRAQRDLALVGATGGDAGQIRQIVLAGGLVLGLIGGAVGTVLGLGLAEVLLPYAPRLSGHIYAGTHPRAIELLGCIAAGVATGVVSAWLPARRAAKASIVASLSGRRGVVGTSTRLTTLGLFAAGSGTALAAAAGRTNRFGGQQINVILFGAAVAELGFAACAPALIGLAGRAAGRLPLVARLSLRDISRNRNRTGPAVAAIMATLSGVVAISVYTASTDARSRADYQVQMPRNAIGLISSDAHAPDASIVAAVRRELPPGTETAFGQPVGSDLAHIPVAQTDDIVNVTTPALLTALGDPQAAAALAAGRIVTLGGPALPPTTPISVQKGSATKDTAPIATYASRVGPYAGIGTAFVSVSTATRIGLNQPLNAVVITVPTALTKHQRDAAVAALLATQSPNAPSRVSAETESGVDDGKSLLVPLALLAVSTVVTFGVTTISTALSGAESRPDLATLGAVGATPFLRRRLAMSQAAVLAFLGGLLGIAAGLVPIAAVLAVRSSTLTFTLPWQVVVLALVVVPLVSATGAGVFTGTRQPLVRRLT